MKKFLLIFSTIFFFCLSAYSQDKIINENITFKPFKCNQIKSEFIRTKSENECLVIQKLENSYEVKHQKYSDNTWNTPQLIKYINNKEGEKIIAHTWNNVVEWGKKSDKQPFSHLVNISLDSLDNLFNKNNIELKSNHISLPLTARRMNVLDVDSDGNKEIIYLGNREDGRNRNSSWKDVNYIFDLNNNELKSFGSSHFSHDLMYFDFNKDGHYEIIDYFYGDQKPGAIEVCDIKTNKCRMAKKANNFLKHNPTIKLVYGVDNTGDIYNPENIKFLINKFKHSKANLITADGGFDFSVDYKNQEQNSYQLIICEIVCALGCLKEGGHFVIKIFEMLY